MSSHDERSQYYNKVFLLSLSLSLSLGRRRRRSERRRRTEEEAKERKEGGGKEGGEDGGGEDEARERDGAISERQLDAVPRGFVHGENITREWV